MTPLEQILRAEISASGPVSVARYMDLCLGHPDHGYYRKGDPLGAGGDFTTAPEISQLFGEALGIWAVALWQAMGQGAVKLIELGPGRGTLASDMLRVLRQFGAAPEIWLVETSEPLRRIQSQTVPGARWVEQAEQVPDGPAIIVANEFLDALPVRQFLCGRDGWSERLIGLRDDALAWGLSPPLRRAGVYGDWREQSEAADRTLDWIAGRIQASPGGALVVDYGYRAGDRPVGPTLQAMRAHSPSDPLDAPGLADLTWLIDFDNVAARIGASVADQGAFLTAMGIGARAEALARAAPDQAVAIADALDRLTAPVQMGTLFKVAGAVSPGLPIPPGFNGE